MDFVVTNRDTLNRLRRDSSLRRTVRRIKIDSRLELGDAGKLESQINRSYFSCGCRSGILTVYAALALVGATWRIAPGITAWVWWKVALVGIIAAFVGKVAGLLVGRYRLKRALDRLDQSLPV